MNIRHAACLRWLLPATLVSVQISFAEISLPVIQSNTQTFSNVTVQSKTATHVFIRHAQGYATLKVKNLDLETQKELGYAVEPTTPVKKPSLAERIPIDPQVREMQTKLVGDVQERIRNLDRRLIPAVLGGLFVLYLFFCHCCALICKKTSNEPGLVIWLPVLKIFPMLRAAGMPAWWFLLTLLPGTNVVVFVVWCVKICHARGKSGWLALFLMLPVSNVLTFLYLAFSSGQAAEEVVMPTGQFRFQP